MVILAAWVLVVGALRGRLGVERFAGNLNESNPERGTYLTPKHVLGFDP